MKLTRGECWALLCYAVVLLGFLPGMWAAILFEGRVLGLPVPLLWAGGMVLLTAGAMSLAFVIKERIDR